MFIGQRIAFGSQMTECPVGFFHHVPVCLYLLQHEAVDRYRLAGTLTGTLCAGRMTGGSKRYGVEEGIVFAEPTIEFSYKNDALGDPLINAYHAIALKLATRDELSQIRAYALQINEILKAALLEVGITLADFKLEFGKTSDGTLILADEISPDTCRFWDSKTGEKLDKDRFRRDLGGVEDAYLEMRRRVLGE